MVSPTPVVSPARPDTDGRVIRVDGLTKAFGAKVALDNVTLEINRGQICALLGPNGAGKSTLMNLLLGLVEPSAGRCTVLGHDPGSEALAIKRRTGVVPEGSALFDRLTGREQLEFCGRIYGLEPAELGSRIETLLDLTELTNDADRAILGYSTGMRKKIALCCALVHGPELLLLDEPFENLDPQAAATMQAVVRKIAVGAGVTVLIASHGLHAIESLATDLAILDRGRLVLSGALASHLGGTRSLEDLYLGMVGRDPAKDTNLGWFGR